MDNLSNKENGKHTSNDEKDLNNNDQMNTILNQSNQTDGSSDEMVVNSSFENEKKSVESNSTHQLNDEQAEKMTKIADESSENPYEQSSPIRTEENSTHSTISPSQSVKPKKSKKPVMKWLISCLAVGVVSSLLTVGLASKVNLPINEKNEEEATVASTIQNQTDAADYTATFAGTDPATIADVVEEVSPTIVGVVNIKQLQNQFSLQSQDVQAGTGSGVIFIKDNQYAYIITNNHVIEGANEVEVSLYNGEHVKAEIVGADALTDLAVLRIDQNHVQKVASFGDSSILRPGDEVIAIGNPLGLNFSRTVTQGIVSAIERSVPVSTSAGEWELSVVQTDAAINPGNSGGALINSNGEVIGINSLKISSAGVEGLGFAIPSNDVLPIAQQLIDNGEVQRAFLGISMYDIQDIVSFYRQSMYGNVENGIVVADVGEGSPAQKAGLQVNDVIIGINGNEVKNTTELRKYLYGEIQPGDTVEVEFFRNGEKHKVSITTTAN